MGTKSNKQISWKEKVGAGIGHYISYVSHIFDYASPLSNVTDVINIIIKRHAFKTANEIITLLWYYRINLKYHLLYILLLLEKWCT